MKKEMFDNNPLLRTTFSFSLLIIQYCEKLEEQKKYVIARQLLKSGTAIGANAMEAQHGESKADFVHKIKIAAKEAEETQYWLWLCKESPGYPDCGELIGKVAEINRLLTRILSTARSKINK